MVQTMDPQDSAGSAAAPPGTLSAEQHFYSWLPTESSCASCVEGRTSRS